MINENTTAERTPQERLEAAHAELDSLNRFLPPGAPPLQLPPIVEIMAHVEALTLLLIDKGVITEPEFLERKTIQQAEKLEDFVGQLREMRRQATGLVIAGPGQHI